MISDEQLDRFRLEGIRVRVVRDGMESNDVIGQVLAWDDEQVMIRKRNRKVLRVSRSYGFQPADEERIDPLERETQA